MINHFFLHLCLIFHCIGFPPFKCGQHRWKIFLTFTCSTAYAGDHFSFIQTFFFFFCMFVFLWKNFIVWMYHTSFYWLICFVTFWLMNKILWMLCLSFFLLGVLWDENNIWESIFSFSRHCQLVFKGVLPPCTFSVT